MVVSMMLILGPGLFLCKTVLLILRYMQNLVLDFFESRFTSLIVSTLWRNEHIGSFSSKNIFRAILMSTRMGMHDNEYCISFLYLEYFCVVMTQAWSGAVACGCWSLACY